MTTIYISGVHSGPNPSPGVGLARSLRASFPDMRLVAVDYSSRSAGIHHDIFDDVLLFRPWNELDIDSHARHISKRLEGEAFWLSGLDLEVSWLASVLPQHPQILTPSKQALAVARKPCRWATQYFQCEIPPTIDSSVPDWEQHAFARLHDWHVWVKGPDYEARYVRTWSELLHARAELRERWASNHVLLQAGIWGHEETIAFAAFKGRLLDGVQMQKRVQTSEGKTWSARVTEMSESMRADLTRMLAEASWTGGGELEFVVTDDGKRYLLDWNPRFPAWIHGATLAGHNLPATLVGAADGSTPLPTPAISSEFSRVVLEIPANPRFPLPTPQAITRGSAPLGKHPSGMPVLARRLADSKKRSGNAKAVIPANMLDDIARMAKKPLETPKHLFLEQSARQRFDYMTRQIAESSSPGCKVNLAYSTKTNPHPRLLRLALEQGWLAEAIAVEEVQRVTEIGFSPEQVILNGPQAYSVGRLGMQLHAVFADSIESLETLTQMSKAPARYLGLRLKPARAHSRFGIDLSDYATFERAVKLLRDAPGVERIGVHFHSASDTQGVEWWWAACDVAMTWASALESATGRPVSLVDIGGGFFPDDFDHHLAPRLPRAVAAWRQKLPNLEQLLLEPGKAVAQPTMALATKVLELRRSPKGEQSSIVVDGSISDLPMAAHYPHRIVATDASGRVEVLADGEELVFGRICMETDVLATGISIPSWLDEGCMLFFLDAGAYDMSMSYDFGRGSYRHA